MDIGQKIGRTLDHGIRTRLFASPPSLRFGRPADEPGFSLVRQEVNGRSLRYTTRGTKSAPWESAA